MRIWIYQLVKSIKDGTAEEFRQKYRNVDLFLVDDIQFIARKEDPNFPNATLIKEEVLLPSTTVERAYPQFSPDGKELAFIEDRNRLMVLNLDSKKVRQITDGSTWYNTAGGFDYSWSPDFLDKHVQFASA